MIGKEKVLGLITARGGSKRLPGKNLALVAGKPLIAWTIDEARQSKFIDRLVLSSDSVEIISTALSYGCEAPFKRADFLASDEASSIDVVMDALARCSGYDWIVLLQPTSPGRIAADIDAAISLCMETGAPAVVSVCLAQENPRWMYRLGVDRRLTAVVSLPESGPPPEGPVHRLNGAVYVARTGWLAGKRSFISDETVAYEMPISRSVDIDFENDLEAFRKTVE